MFTTVQYKNVYMKTKTLNTEQKRKKKSEENLKMTRNLLLALQKGRTDNKDEL